MSLVKWFALCLSFSCARLQMMQRRMSEIKASKYRRHLRSPSVCVCECVCVVIFKSKAVLLSAKKTLSD